MTAGWVAAAVRGRALLRRSVGRPGALELAGAGSWPEAASTLRATPYGEHLPERADRAAAHRAAAASTLWQLRVLAGWLPPGATGLTRIAAGPFEIANIELHIDRLLGSAPDRGRLSEALPLGSLATAWPRVSAATSIDQVRSALSSSVWGDPGGNDAAMLVFGLRAGWARRLLRASPLARPWASGMLAMLVARERFVFDRSITEVTGRELDRVLGRGWRTGSTPAEVAARTPESASWSLAGIDDPADLWRSELAIIRRVTTDARPVARTGRYGRDTVVAILALLLVDLWRVEAAIEAAGRGTTGAEVLDAVEA